MANLGVNQRQCSPDVSIVIITGQKVDGFVLDGREPVGGSQLVQGCVYRVEQVAYWQRNVTSAVRRLVSRFHTHRGQVQALGRLQSRNGLLERHVPLLQHQVMPQRRIDVG